jgi:Tfp pilus assembly protein PilP
MKKIILMMIMITILSQNLNEPFPANYTEIRRGNYIGENTGKINLKEKGHMQDLVLFV